MKKTAILLTLALCLAGCQAQRADQPKSNESPPETKHVSSQEKNVIAKLQQTTEHTALRDAAYEKVKKSDTLTGGYFGENTPELQEDMGVQSIEAEAVMGVINALYGNFYDYGIIYGKNRMSGDEEPGFWVGIKNPDKRADELVHRLQKQVDEGKILAKYIHLFESEYSEKDNEVLLYNVSKAIKPMREAMPEPDRVTLGMNVDTVTRTVEIEHDFLTKKQRSELASQFSGYQLAFTQSGRMLPLPDGKNVEYPKKAVTDKPSTKGSWVMSVSPENFLVDAVYYTFPNADQKIKIGQRILVESSGYILESFPGQGSAKFVTVLPAYKPKTANLTDEEALRQALLSPELNKRTVYTVERVAYDWAADKWTISFLDPMQTDPKTKKPVQKVLDVPDEK